LDFDDFGFWEDSWKQSIIEEEIDNFWLGIEVRNFCSKIEKYQNLYIWKYDLRIPKKVCTKIKNCIFNLLHENKA
jgi:hypothetical protein